MLELRLLATSLPVANFRFRELRNFSLKIAKKMPFLYSTTNLASRDTKNFPEAFELISSKAE